ncbi:hypothetical protein EPA93_46265 [Ktedonosporobacter rubrisoli]|uniref:Uncharacterized protein n=1 Tax=Ktedonosporobacter rubrisoli TaxID=2509675 RepID=A0A4P6K3X9_KTERU|nr:hypothetical protein [Ktedonosporobacter rubrisoli]QBD82978.1 hypothetical protein EPA93_46265 [Ktedonosporobacter rubrisoli]
MNNDRDFDDEDKNIFSDKEISQIAPSKGNRIIPTWLKGDLMSWFDCYHPEISMLSNLPRCDLEQFINEFEYFTGKHYDFTLQEWQYALKHQ